MSEAESITFIDDVVENHLLPVINTPLSELGKHPCVWDGCLCERNKCSACWVEKNYWEATGSPRRINPWKLMLGCTDVTAIVNGQKVKLTAEQVAELAKKEVEE
jgi:hypothetical protein